MKLLSLRSALKAYLLLSYAGSHLQSGILLLIRMAWGWQLLESGYGHLSDVAGTAKHFTDWGIPYPTLNVYISGSTELIGGALLMLGLLSRFISVPLFFNFCVAYLTASRDEVTHLFTQNPDAIINDAAFPFLVTSLLILAFGPGRFSIDYIIHRFLISPYFDRAIPGPEKYSMKMPS